MKFEQSINVSAQPADVFAAYKAVSDWPKWDPETESASIDGEFAVGTVGKIKPKGTPESKIALVEVTPDNSFTVECALPLCKMRFIHVMDKHEEGTALSNIVEFTGLLSPVFGRLIGPSINKSLPGSLQGLKEYVESRG